MVWLSAALLLSGCTSTGSGAGPGRAPVARDKVLQEYREGLSAMRRGDFATAKQKLDDALLTVGGIGGPDRDARKSRGLFHRESRKIFIGEPYERAMAWFYRGVIYWMDGEPDNARACFRSAQLADSDTEKKEFSGDWVLMDYLDGLVTTKLAGDGNDAYKRALASSRHGPPKPYQREANVLIFAEFGQGPTKYAAGEYDEQLRFREGRSAVRSVRVTVGNQAVSLERCDSVSFQATTRGGRVMDHILGNKAVFKAATDGVGNAAIVSGAILATQQGRRSAADEVGAGLLVFGLASKIVSAATTPAADTRAWDTLPEWLTFGALKVAPGAHTATVEFLGEGGGPMPGLTRTYKLNIPENSRDLVIFASDRSQ
jgi:hypothetical protein